MKKIIALALALVATNAYAIVANTPHDLSAAGNGVCRYCHTPHHSNPNVTQAPIWARTLGTTITAYGKFSPSLSTTNMSLLCMSCHDGVTGLGTMWNGSLTYNSTGRAIDTVTDTGSNLGTSLGNDHPVGITYDTTITSAGLVSQATAISAGFRFFDSTGAESATGRMECGTCHDPHVYSSVTSDANYKFKRTVTGDFCAACHANK